MPILHGIHYLHHEKGGRTRPPVVLLHGAGGDHLSWPAEVRRLAKASVFALDLPGHGKSPGHGRQSVEDYARAAAGFLREAAVSNAVLVGHCLGGAIALRLAIDFPDRVAGLVIIASGSRLPIPSSLLDNSANASTLPLALQTLEELSFGPHAAPSLREAAFRRMRTIRPALLHGDLVACDRFSVRGELERVCVPTLVLCGTADRLTPLRFSEALASGIPGAALQTIEEAGHLLLLEQPRRVASLVSVFLATLPEG